MRRMGAVPVDVTMTSALFHEVPDDDEEDDDEKKDHEGEDDEEGDGYSE
jgi:hypothetical protein